MGDRKTLSTLPTISGVGSVAGEGQVTGGDVLSKGRRDVRTAMMPAPWKGTGGGPLPSGKVRDPPGRSLRKGKLQGPPDCRSLRCLSGLVISLKPARFQNKHVQLPRRTILAARPQAFAGRSLRAVSPAARVGGGRLMHIHQHVDSRAAGRACALLAQPSPSPRQWLGKPVGGLQGGEGGQSNADRQTFGGGAVGKPWCSIPPPQTHPQSLCPYVFKKFSRTKIFLDSQTHPPRSFFVVLLSSTTFSFLCQRLGFSRIDRKKMFKEIRM